MKEHPILFNAEMIRAILAGRKTQTRRVIKPQPSPDWAYTSIGQFACRDGKWIFPTITEGYRDTWSCPYGKIGDHLWVRETLWRQYRRCGETDPYTLEQSEWDEETGKIIYCADGDNIELPDDGAYTWWEKKPSIHTFRHESRITLEVLDIRVERVQSIDHNGIRAEGIEKQLDWTSLEMYYAFSGLWDRINIKRGYSWQSNPWVWVIEFKVLETNQ